MLAKYAITTKGVELSRLEPTLPDDSVVIWSVQTTTRVRRVARVGLRYMTSMVYIRS